MRKGKPFFSVVVPVYNRAFSISRCIESVLNQDFQSFELIVIDDNSTDETLSILLSYSDPRLVVLRTNGLRHPGAVRNIGIQHSKGVYICFLDSDDMFLPGKLRLLDNYASMGCPLFIHHECMLIHSGTDAYKLSGSRNLLLDRLSRPLIELGNGIVTSSVAVSRRCLVENSLYFQTDPLYYAWEDYELWIRIFEIAKHSNAYMYIKACLSIVYQGSSSISDSASSSDLYLRMDTALSKEVPMVYPWLLWACLRYKYKLPNHYTISGVAKSLIKYPNLWLKYFSIVAQRSWCKIRR